MWIFPKTNLEQVIISLSATHAFVGWIHAKSNRFMLHHYTVINWNRSWHILTQELQLFIEKHRLNHSLLHIVLCSPLIHEQFISLGHASASFHELNNSALKKMFWDYRYLYTNDTGNSTFYVTGATAAPLFSCRLLSMRLQTRLTTITSNYMSLIQAYSALCGPTFRQSQLALTLATHHYALEDAISADSIVRLLPINPLVTIDIHEHKIPLLHMIGTLNQERIS